MTLSRRNFLKKTGIALATLAVDPSASAKEAQNENLFSILDKPEFQNCVSRDGAPLNVAALKQAVKDDYVIINFGWNGCDSLCPQIDAVLAHVGSFRKDKLATLAINVMPGDDNVSQTSRDAFVDTIRSRGIKHKIIPVFPRDVKTAKDIQIDGFHVITDPIIAHAAAHSPMLLLFGPGGEFIAKKPANQEPENFDSWKALLNQPEKARQ